MVQRLAYGILKHQCGLFLPYSVDEMHKHLGVGRTAEGITVRREFKPQSGMIFDDAIMDQRNVACRIEMGVSVAIAGVAMRRPSGMRNSGNGSAELVAALPESIFKIGHAPFLLHYRKSPVQHGNTC